jgi:protein TonB
MNALSPAQMPLMPANIWNQVKRIGPLGAIILLHIAFFYALQSGLIKQAAALIPKEVFVSFISPEPAPVPEPPKEQPKVKPKTVPILKKTVAPPLPVLRSPSPTAVTAPESPPQPPAPVAVAPDPSPAPPAPAAPATPRTVSGVEYVQKPQPEYPAASKRMGETGRVLLKVLVNEKGRADSVEIRTSSGSSRLDDAARQAVRRALFKPYTEDGKPVPVYAIVPIDFKLDN